MASCSLITLARAKNNLGDVTTTPTEDAVLNTLIAAVSDAIEVYCRRRFCATQYDELYDGVRRPVLALRHYPIVSVERVAYDPATVLTARNDASAVQRATVAVTSTGVTLTRVTSGVTATDTLAFADYPTLDVLVAAISGLGNGWSARVTQSRYDKWASSDLRSPRGAVAAKGVDAPLKLHVRELSDFEIAPQRGWLLRSTCTPWPIGDEGPFWEGGRGYWRIVYTAGYATVPEDVQEACAQWVAALFWQTKRDPGLVQEHVPGAFLRVPAQGMPPAVRDLLAGYRRITIAAQGE